MIVAVITFTYTSTRNYLGSRIWDNQRMGKRYTTQERLDISIGNYLQRQTVIGLLDIEFFTNNNRRKGEFFEELVKRFILMPYNSKEEFLKENPRCYERTWGLVEGGQFGFWARTEQVTECLSFIIKFAISTEKLGPIKK